MGQVAIDWNALAQQARLVFGIGSWRPGQRELIEAVLEGRDALGILPTGGGKSLCFELPSLFLPRLVIVVTPLISLAEDQTDKLDAAHVATTRIDSTLGTAELRQAESALRGGKLELVYVTPERLQHAEFLTMARSVGCSLLVVDETHCVSQWGHDFRPAYAQLRAAAQALGRPPILALTATATKVVAEDIAQQLELRDPCVVRVSSARPNLHLAVRPAAGQKLQLLEQLLDEPGSGLVYTATVRAAREVFAYLLGRDLSVGLYHGQLQPAVRHATHAAFMDGRYRIVVATKAFGMGIDKPDTRSVVHYQLPDSLESYAQESGRAGRDGAPAKATLLFDPKDERVQRYFLLHKCPPARAVSDLVQWLARQPAEVPLDWTMLAETVTDRWRNVLCCDLVNLGFVQHRDQTLVLSRPLNDTQALRALGALHDERVAIDRRRLEQMIDYANLGSCRTAHLMHYFDESAPEHCDRCDNCDERKTRVVHRTRRPSGQSGPT
jgi:ATP-dependent DNA helicase RecQ